jgi:hypothetical protein
MRIVRAWRRVLLGAFLAAAMCAFLALEAEWVQVSTFGGAQGAVYVVLGIVLAAGLMVGGTAALVRWMGASRAETVFAGTLMLVIVDAAGVFFTVGMLGSPGD